MMLKNTDRIFFALILTFSALSYSCTKISPDDDESVIEEAIAGLETAARDGDSILLRSNEEILNAVVSGTGGYAYFGLTTATFPIYQPPVNVGGMLHFPSTNDYNLFIDAVGLMEDIWNYSIIEYEGTPQEIYHLGDEALSALDSVLGFSSLRSQYELYDYYNHDWADTVAVNVDDDDYETVMNRSREVKIGNKFYKHVSGNIVAIINNSNTELLSQVRAHGLFVKHTDVVYFDEELNEIVDPTATEGTSQVLGGCNDFDMYAYANNLTPQSTTNQWTVELDFAGYYRTSFLDNLAVLADYTINWGDGNTESFRDRFYNPTKRRHVYSQVIAPGSTVQKQLLVTCRMVNPTASELFHCANPTAVLLQQGLGVTLSHPPPIQCLWGTYKRSFNGVEQFAGSTKYRLECKLIQKTSPTFGFSKMKMKATFTKWTGSRWKKTKPVSSVSVNLRGDVYNTSYCDIAQGGCISLIRTLNESKTTMKKKTLKLKVKGLPCFTTNRITPFAINADFIWKYNRNQNTVGNYNEVLKP
jgi:hypothetical protein